MSTPTGGLLLVHAHPDDETIATGATMAVHARAGVPVTLVTCTRGEQGEVIPLDLAHLAAPVAGDGGLALAAHRVQELAVAMAALGVHDHRFLDEAAEDGRTYRDSGMALDEGGHVVLPDDVAPDAFALADVEDAAALLAGVLHRRRPDAVVTYDPGGGYGHPDHVQAHRVTMRAVELAADGGRAVPRTYWAVLAASVAAARSRTLREAAGTPFGPEPDGPVPSMVVPDDRVDVVVDGRDAVRAKAAALRAHATQVLVEEPYYALSNLIGAVIGEEEHYHLVRSHSVLPAPPGPGALV